MQPNSRMSPLTAFFLGLFGVGAVGVAAGALVLLFGLRMVDRHFGAAIQIVESGVTNLPELIEGLPPAIKDALHDRRAPQYAESIETSVDMISGDGGVGGVPALTIRNKGPELVSLLTVRVAALDASGRALREWTTVAATPIGIENEWRGPLMPGATRHMVLNQGCYGHRGSERAFETLSVEITDVRVWTPSETAVALK